MRQIDAMCAKLNAEGFEAKTWKDQRIYLNGYGRDIKAYITFDDPTHDLNVEDESDTLFAGCGLKVYSDCEQSRSWLINRAKQVKHSIMLRLNELNIIPWEVCKNWQEVIL